MIHYYYLFISNQSSTKKVQKRISPIEILEYYFQEGWYIKTFDRRRDYEFQNKYSVTFLSQGCIRNGIDENEEAYNKVVFAFLDKKYGKKWRYEIRTDAIGFKQ